LHYYTSIIVKSLHDNNISKEKEIAFPPQIAGQMTRKYKIHVDFKYA